MALSNYSVFYFGTKITSLNQNLNFDEGGGELTAQIEPGTYSLTDFMLAIKTAMDAASTIPQEYTVVFDRTTRQITISSDANFDLLVGTGSQIGTSPFPLMGFSGADLTGNLTYSGNSGAGSEYITQFPLQDYTESQDNQQRIDPSVNESASGVIEIVSFGVRKIFEMSFKFITDIPQPCFPHRSNPNGRADARAFFEFITERGPIEFMPNVIDRNTFFKVILESTPQDRRGTAFKLNELVGQGLPGYYEINNIKMREV
jgi:hypothetical protein